MYNEQVFQPERNQPNLNSVSPSPLAATEPMVFSKAAQSNVQLSNSTLILVPFSLVTLWMIALACFKHQTKRQGIRRETRPQLYKRVPCRRCIFFKDNPYLKCAIRPIDALTANAIDCTDYASHADFQHKP